jgi:hypothetical protein
MKDPSIYGTSAKPTPTAAASLHTVTSHHEVPISITSGGITKMKVSLLLMKCENIFLTYRNHDIWTELEHCSCWILHHRELVRFCSSSECIQRRKVFIS